MKKVLLTLMTLTVLLSVSFFVSKTFASSPKHKVIETKTAETQVNKQLWSKVDEVAENTNFQQLYRDGVSTSVIDPKVMSYDQWVKENKDEFIPIYQEGIDKHVYVETPLSYDEWIKLNHYGIPPN